MMYSAPDKKVERLTSVTTQLLLCPEVSVAALVIVLLLRKITYMQPEAKGPIFFAVVQHDAAIVALILFFYAAAAAAARWGNDGGIARPTLTTLSRLCMAACLLVVVLYVADVLIYHFFITRLYAGDVVTFSLEPRAALSLFIPTRRIISDHAAWKFVIAAVLILLLLRAFYVLLARPVRSPVRSRFLVAAAVPLAILSLVPVPGYVYTFTDKALYENFIERNHDFFVRNNFSDGFRTQILSAPPPVEACTAGRGRRLNVILLVVESLSAYQSRFFSGIEDWTPQLDKIATQETALTNFYANGWTTGGGLVSLLTRTFPFIPENSGFKNWGSPRLTDFLDARRSLPRTLSEEGYATEFVAAGDLKFLKTDTWLRTIGFQKLVSEDDPRFAGQKERGPFNCVPDRLLYDVALDELARMPVEKPYFMVVQTFWSHTPFIDPNGGGMHHAEPVIRDTDKQIGVFVERLRAAGFFQKGLLFITGDHRAMELFRKAEFEHFGALAVARIPAVIVTRAVELPRVIAQDFQQRDFGASIEALVGDRYCLGPQEGSFLSDPPIPPSCIMHARGDDRDLIFVKCGTAEGTVRAAGDATRFVSGAVPDETSIIQTINRTRVSPGSNPLHNVYRPQ